MIKNPTDKISADPSDASLMKEIINGSEVAFETLMRRHEDSVFWLANRILNGNKEEARDTAQEVFIRLWENPRAWKPTALFTTWLYRVTTNRALNKLRSMKLKSFFSLTDYTSDNFPSSDETPDERMESKEDEVDFEKKFSKLPARQKAALHLRYREEMSVADVAEALGVSLKSAESLLFRARKTLRES
ncbi:sigma-70 family RNA polymerase sigma factor [bacterium]|nr:sigma-70 family RNA polymerase sigma factor [bacterium]